MNSQTSRKIVVASAMAAVVGIGVVTFALRSHPVAAVVQTPHPPTRVAQIPDAPAVVAQDQDAPAPVAHDDSVGNETTDIATTSAVESKLDPSWHLAKASTSVVATNVDRVKSADELTTDSQITTDVKTEIASDNLSKDANIGVTTTRGVVVLTGTVASQDAIDHVKDVAGKVKDVKSVDTSALIVASL